MQFLLSCIKCVDLDDLGLCLETRRHWIQCEVFKFRQEDTLQINHTFQTKYRSLTPDNHSRTYLVVWKYIIPFGNQDSEDEAISVGIYVVLWKINPHSSPSIQDESISETLEYLFLLHKQEPRNPKQNSEKFIIPIEKLHFV
jgi:hypothetical protein